MDIADQLIAKVESLQAARHGDEVNLVEVLQASTAIEDLVTQLVSPVLGNAVFLLRSSKVSWAEIGMELGISRQAAWERFHKYERGGELALPRRNTALQGKPASPQTAPANVVDSFSFAFTVNRSFIRYHPHPITTTKVVHDELVKRIGDRKRSIVIVGPDGAEMRGHIRHGVSSRGPYFQIGIDAGMAGETICGLELGQPIAVEIVVADEVLVRLVAD